jgi:LmbE family N-acetylglucosaminyl deacetylase
LKKKVLVVAGHPDDEILGCGGTMAAHVKQGDTVHVAILAQGLASRGTTSQMQIDNLRRAACKANACLGVVHVSFGDYPDNEMDTIPRLEVIKYVERLIEQFEPDIVYTHHAGDVNVDHRRVSEAVVTACRPRPDRVRTLLFFEVPSSTEWQTGGQNRVFDPNLFCDITEFLEVKLLALHAYSGEMREWPHPRSIEAVEHLARWRGATVCVPAAEAFMLGRQLISQN